MVADLVHDHLPVALALRGGSSSCTCEAASCARRGRVRGARPDPGSTSACVGAAGRSRGDLTSWRKAGSGDRPARARERLAAREGSRKLRRARWSGSRGSAGRR